MPAAPAAPGSGSELEIFAHARNWKRYWSGIVARYVRGSVLDVGAGIGSNISLLLNSAERWVCLEPDPKLVQRLRDLKTQWHDRCEVVCGQLQDLETSEQFDTILYVDVLEHIQDDRREMDEAASRLKPGGSLVVLVPAHQWLFTPFDRVIGHFRRYNAASLLACSPPVLKLDRMLYLDSVGLCASLGNKLLLRQSMPSQRQIMIWDKVMVPLSRSLDPILGHRFGKSLLAVWRKSPS